MAYAAIICLELTLQKILIHPYIFLGHLEQKDIESFREKVEFLLRFLKEHEHPSHQTNEQIASLERKIRDAAYEADDLLDIHLNNLCNSEEIIWRLEIEPMTKKLDSIIEEVTEIKEQGSLEEEIDIMEKGSLEEEIEAGERGKHKDFEPQKALDFSKLVLSGTKNLTVGFDDHMIQIKDQLTGQSSALEVISIVGMGGIGKTTLATNLYNDPFVVNQFDVRAWVTVSQSYSKRHILSSMLDSMSQLSKGDQLGQDVYQNLKGRRYLIVLDDIWDTTAWDELRMVLPDDKTRSRIILTSRIAEVATYASPLGTLHQISPLGNEQSWKLLCAKVFGDEPCPLNLQEIGKTIAENCRGLPLSIVVIGGLLSNLEMAQEEWQFIAENLSSLVLSSSGKCSRILRLSYNYLPQYLKACFLYMGIFPKSHDISVSKLTMMWVAEGFLGQAHGQNLEDMAERCVDDLLDRSLILKCENNSEGKIKAFRIHDLLLDFCIEEAKHEKFLQIIKSPSYLFPAIQRRISIRRVKEFEQSWFLDSMSSTSYIRSLVFMERCSLSSNLLLRFKLLRVLDATEVTFFEFPSEALELLNLRYIALACYGHIPASITKLWDLQTLVIVPYLDICGESYLPVEIWYMSHLRYVKCYGANFLDPMDAKFDVYRKHLVLEGLHSLSGLWNLTFTEEMLQRIPNIKELAVFYDIHCVIEKGWSYYQLENLGSLDKLKALKIRVIPDPSTTIESTFKFHFPASLKTLTLGGVRIPWHDLAIISSLPNLEVLKLKDHACIGTEWKLDEEEFCELKVLVLEELDLEHWEADSSHFPSLQRLIIRWCYSLVEIPSGFGESTTLTTIGLDECNDTVWNSAKEIQEIQLSCGNYGLQVVNEYSAVRHSKRMFFGFRIMKGAKDDSQSTQTVTDEDDEEMIS